MYISTFHKGLLLQLLRLSLPHCISFYVLQCLQCFTNKDEDRGNRIEKKVIIFINHFHLTTNSAVSEHHLLQKSFQIGEPLLLHLLFDTTKYVLSLGRVAESRCAAVFVPLPHLSCSSCRAEGEPTSSLSSWIVFKSSSRETSQ